MSNIIHMEVEKTEEMCRTLTYKVTDLLDTADEMRYQVRRLNGAWEGGGAGGVISAMENTVRALEADVASLDRLVASLKGEIAEWVEMDAVGNPVWNYVKDNWKDILEGTAKMGVAGYFASHLTTSALRPNSVILHAPDLIPSWLPKGVQQWLTPHIGKRALREFIGINGHTNVIKPGTLASKLAPAVTVAAVAVDVAPQIYDDWKEYGWSDRFASAATVDFAVKGGLALAGVAAVGAVAAAVAGAPLIVAGGAILLAGVGVGLITDAVWGAFTDSGARDATIEWVNRAGDKAANWISGTYQSAADGVSRAWNGFINSITGSAPEPSPAAP